MEVGRRVLLGLGAGAFLAKEMLLPDWAAAGPMQTEGVKPPPPTDRSRADALLNAAPADYLEAMEYLASLGRGFGVGVDGRPFNERWPVHANPLIVRLWTDQKLGYVTNDCGKYCGVTLGWCLHRSGRTPPADFPSSQAYLTYGSEVTAPQKGDIVVFTNYGDEASGHVTIFLSAVDAKTIEVVGGNQQLSGTVNCGGGLGVSTIDRRTMAIDTRKDHPGGRKTGHWVRRYVRPPPPTFAPAVPVPNNLM